MPHRDNLKQHPIRFSHQHSTLPHRHDSLPFEVIALNESHHRSPTVITDRFRGLNGTLGKHPLNHFVQVSGHDLKNGTKTEQKPRLPLQFRIRIHQLKSRTPFLNPTHIHQTHSPLRTLLTIHGKLGM
jgi:hypothetical protein